MRLYAALAGVVTSMIREREYGIDLLRILAMLMICVLHVLRQSGVLAAAQGSAEYAAAWALECACYCAVNCYALISGYVGAESGFKYRKIVKLWLQVVFYSVGISVLFHAFAPDKASLLRCVQALFPVVEQEYWYFTAYFGMFFFVPYMNKLLRSLERRQLNILAATVIVILCLLPSAKQEDIYRLYNGYSILWLSALYILGGCAKLCGWKERVSAPAAAAAYALCAAITWLDVVYMSGRAVMLGGCNLYEFGKLANYTSPTVLLAGIFLLLAFSHMKLGAKPLTKLLALLSPATFGVYLIHTQHLVLTYTLRQLCSWLGGCTAGKLVLGALGMALAVYLACSLAEIVRAKLFELLGIPRLVDRAADKISKKTAKV